MFVSNATRNFIRRQALNQNQAMTHYQRRFTSNTGSINNQSQSQKLQTQAQLQGQQYYKKNTTTMNLTNEFSKPVTVKSTVKLTKFNNIPIHPVEKYARELGISQKLKKFEFSQSSTMLCGAGVLGVGALVGLVATIGTVGTEKSDINNTDIDSDVDVDVTVDIVDVAVAEKVQKVEIKGNDNPGPKADETNLTTKSDGGNSNTNTNLTNVEEVQALVLSSETLKQKIHDFQLEQAQLEKEDALTYSESMTTENVSLATSINSLKERNIYVDLDSYIYNDSDPFKCESNSSYSDRYAPIDIETIKTTHVNYFNDATMKQESLSCVEPMKIDLSVYKKEIKLGQTQSLRSSEIQNSDSNPSESEVTAVPTVQESGTGAVVVVGEEKEDEKEITIVEKELERAFSVKETVVEEVRV